jgi:hypothetical protein
LCTSLTPTSDLGRLLAILRDGGKPSDAFAPHTYSSGSHTSSSSSSNNAHQFDGFISYRHHVSGESNGDAPPFGVTAAGMFRLVAEKFGLRLWHDM